MSRFVHEPVSVGEGLLSEQSPLQHNNPPEMQPQHFKVYKIRWFMLFLVATSCICTTMQLIHYCIIANIIVTFYGVSYTAVDWTFMTTLVIFILLILPFMYVFDKIETRTSLVISIGGICAATWIRVASVAPSRFWVEILGQVVVSLSHIFILIFPARFASDWFRKDETGIACSVGILAQQLGIGLSCIIPVMVVKLSQNQDEIARDLYTLNIGVAILCTFAFVLNLIFFKSKPLTPPTNAQKQLREIDKGNFKDSTMQLFKNMSFVLLLFAYALSNAILYTIMTLLNQIILHYYEFAVEDAGRTGLLMTVSGMAGTITLGYVLDKFQCYRLATIAVYAFYTLSVILFSLALLHSITAVYLASIVLGFFMNAATLVSVEVATDLTYPVPATTSSGYLLAASEVAGLIFVYSYSFILYNYSALLANIICCVVILVCTILVICMKFELRRKAADALRVKCKQENQIT